MNLCTSIQSDDKNDKIAWTIFFFLRLIILIYTKCTIKNYDKNKFKGKYVLY